MADKVLAALKKASGDLLYPSETDAPFEPFVWDRGKNTVQAVREKARVPASVECEQQSLEDFFGDLMDEKDFQVFRKAIESLLSDVKVYRCGEIKVSYFVVGTDAAGRLAGFKTTAVET